MSLHRSRWRAPSGSVSGEEDPGWEEGQLAHRKGQGKRGLVTGHLAESLHHICPTTVSHLTRGGLTEGGVTLKEPAPGPRVMAYLEEEEGS